MSQSNSWQRVSGVGWSGIKKKIEMKLHSNRMVYYLSLPVRVRQLREGMCPQTKSYRTPTDDSLFSVLPHVSSVSLLRAFSPIKFILRNYLFPLFADRVTFFWSNSTLVQIRWARWSFDSIVTFEWLTSAYVHSHCGAARKGLEGRGRYLFHEQRRKMRKRRVPSDISTLKLSRLKKWSHFRLSFFLDTRFTPPQKKKKISHTTWMER